MNSEVLAPAVQQFIREYDAEPSRLLFQKPLFAGVDQKELVTQIAGRKKCEKKLPLWFSTPGIYYPGKTAIEQSSSALTAAYKSKLTAGDSLADLTGGFGADSFYFSQKVTRVVHCDTDADLSAIATYNATVLKAGNILFKNRDGLTWLKETAEQFATLYLDPSRRAGSSKVFRLTDCLPDVTSYLDLLTAKCERLIIKTSPLLDLQSGLNDLRNVSQIHILSIKNECKEVIWVMDKRNSGEAEIICTELDAAAAGSFSFFASDERAARIEKYAFPLTYLYEPGTALLKGGCFKLIVQYYGVEKLHQHTHLYTSSLLKEAFPGKRFLVNEVSGYKEFTRSNPIKKANVISRNFPLSVEKIRARHKLREGGDGYLFFTTSTNDQLIVILASRL